jgi:quercetin dioxygenase-like cupin family protein
MARLTTFDSAGIAACTVRRGQLVAAPRGPFVRFPGVSEAPVVGAANPAEDMPAGRLAWPHGFHVRALHLEPGSELGAHRRFEPEVLLMHRGAMAIDWESGSLELGPGDTLSVPVGLVRRYRNIGAARVEVYVVHGGDAPAAPRFVV